MKKTILLILIAAILLSNCYSDTVVDLPDNKSVVAINAINFQPDSVWSIELSQSLPYYNYFTDIYIDIAEVHIEDEEGSMIELKPTIQQNRTVYRSDQRPVENKKYKLVVDAPGFPTTKAVSKIPKPVPILKLEIDSSYFLEQKQALSINPNYNVVHKPMPGKLIFNDPPNEVNFYDVRLYVEGKFEFINSQGEIETRINYIEYPLIDSKTYSTVSMLRDDTKFNGLEYGLQFNIPFHLFLLPPGDLHIVLTSLNEDRYKYMKSVELQNINKYDPFAQPVLIHNNIENGVGIFAGFSKSVWILKKPESSDEE